jgi:hypothetical protein
MRLRPGRSEHDLKRRSTLDPAGFFRRSDRTDSNERTDQHGDSPPAFVQPDRVAVSEDGGRPASSDVARPSVSRDSASPSSSPRPAHPRRFSMLRFRHASDSQLSTTAKEHAARDAPPVPPVPASAANAASVASAERSNERT